ncbi:hypothetical protein ACEPAH_4271 [Sanghuangporus vaninii]
MEDRCLLMKLDIWLTYNTPSREVVPGRDTCSSPGIDPIHNYVNYAHTSCMEEFTPDQTTPLKDQVATFRVL